MLKIRNNIIYLTRGDNAKIKLKVHDTRGKDFIYAGMVEIVFSVKKNIKDEKCVVKKVYSNSDTIELEPKDTKELDFGKYIYDVQLKLNEKTFTVISPTSFYVCEEVTI